MAEKQSWLKDARYTTNASGRAVASIVEWMGVLVMGMGIFFVTHGIWKNWDFAGIERVDGPRYVVTGIIMSCIGFLMLGAALRDKEKLKKELETRTPSSTQG